jgi:hypothetical protein
MMRPVLVSTNCLPALPPLRGPLARDLLGPGLAIAATVFALGACAWATWGV